MKNIRIKTLAALVAVVCLSSGFSPQTRSSRQPVAKRGFWVTETDPVSHTTTIQFYAASNYLVSQKKVNKELDIRKLSVRKSLNITLRKELEKDSVAQNLPKLYEIN